MSNNVIDADWTPSTVKGWKHDPVAYSRRCYLLRRTKDRIKTAYVQRLFVGAWALLTVVLVVAVAVK